MLKTSSYSPGMVKQEVQLLSLSVQLGTEWSSVSCNNIPVGRGACGSWKNVAEHSLSAALHLLFLLPPHPFPDLC